MNVDNKNNHNDDEKLKGDKGIQGIMSKLATLEEKFKNDKDIQDLMSKLAILEKERDEFLKMYSEKLAEKKALRDKENE